MALKAALGETGSSGHTTKRREWLGWFGLMGWLFCMINGYIELPNGYSDDNIFWCTMLFQILFALSVIAVSYRYGRAPNVLGKLAYYTTPVAIAMTAVFTVIPQPIGPVLFVLSPVFMAPAAARRVYGILRTAAPGRTLFTYMSGVAAAFLLLHIVIDFYEMVLNYEAPTEIAFLIFAVLAFLVWLGVRRSIDISSRMQNPARRRPSKSLLVGIAALLLAAFWLRQMNNFINYAIEQYDDYLFIPVYVILPPVVFVLFGFWGDRGHEKKSILVGLILLLVAIQFAFLVSHMHSAVEIPLVFVNHFIGNYLIYFIITISVSFIANSKRPVFTASVGFVMYIAARLFNLITGEILPESIQTADAPLFVSTAISSIAFFLLLYFFYQRQQRESTLADALYAMLHGGQGGEAGTADAADGADGTDEAHEAMAAQQIIFKTGLSEEEIEIAMLLVQGVSQRDVARKFHLKASELMIKQNAIRDKLKTPGGDSVIAVIAAQYSLTKRETDMLRYLRDNKSNSDISAELFLSEETIRIHVKNLLKKLPVENRLEVADWVASFSSKTE